MNLMVLSESLKCRENGRSARISIEKMPERAAILVDCGLQLMLIFSRRAHVQSKKLDCGIDAQRAEDAAGNRTEKGLVKLCVAQSSRNPE